MWCWSFKFRLLFLKSVNITPLISPPHSCHRISAISSLVLHVKTRGMPCVDVSFKQSRVPLVVEGENEADRRPGGSVPDIAVPTSCWPATSHHILDGQL